MEIESAIVGVHKCGAIHKKKESDDCKRADNMEIALGKKEVHTILRPAKLTRHIPAPKQLREFFPSYVVIKIVVSRLF